MNEFFDVASYTSPDLYVRVRRHDSGDYFDVASQFFSNKAMYGLMTEKFPTLDTAMERMHQLIISQDKDCD